EATPSAAASSSAPGEVPTGSREVRQKAMPKKKAKVSSGPVVDEESLRRLIQEDELREALGTPKKLVTPCTDELMQPIFNRRKSSRRNKMYAPYGDALVKTTPFNSLPTDTRKLLGVECNWASWLCHPLSGYGVHFFLKAIELGKMQGNLLVELNWKEKAYTDGYKSPFMSGMSASEFPRETILGIRTDFSTLVSAISQAYGPDFFSYIQKHGYTLYDTSLRETWNAPLVLAALEKKAHADLIACENLRAQRAREIEELYTRPYEEVDEPMNTAGSSTDVPADSPFGEMAGTAKQESISAPMETDAPEGSPSGEVSGVKVGTAEGSSFEEVSETKDMHIAGESGKHDTDEAMGSSTPVEELMPDINSSSSKDASDEEQLRDQGIWGKQKNVVEPGAYEAEAKAATEAEAKNEQAFEDMAGAKEKEGLVDTVEHQNFIEAYRLVERVSLLMRLADQQNGYGQTGLYHDNIRLDDTNSFKVQHMYFRVKVHHHYHMKYNFAEEGLMEQMCRMEPIYNRRSTRMDVVFRAGDFRSTLDDREMARASHAREEALELNHMPLERLKELNRDRRSAGREELMNAMLHYFKQLAWTMMNSGTSPLR
ncbi:unnamed protein product, partial [Symbiodinium necroappetens]